MFGKIIVILTVFLIVNVLAMYSSKVLEGYPVGYLSNCPKSNRQPIITKKSLKYLSFVIQGPGSYNMAIQKKYNYFKMKELSQDPSINWDRKTVVYVGGFLDSPRFPVARNLAPVYRKLGYNVLLLDTNRFTTMEYPVAALFSRIVGQHAAEMLVNLTSTGLDPKKLEIIGLSLGAHTASFISKNYQLLTGMNVSRLTGLDPAGPCFRNLGPGDRLDQTDADFVDVINTNIDGFGMAAPVGHVNFYVNGGEFQPGDVLWMLCNTLCSHIRSYTLWLAALQNPGSFIAMQCESVQDAREKNCYDRTPRVRNIMGLETDRSKEGVFYLTTDNNYPYALGEKGLKKENEFFTALMKRLVDRNSMKI